MYINPFLSSKREKEKNICLKKPVVIYCHATQGFLFLELIFVRHDVLWKNNKKTLVSKRGRDFFSRACFYSFLWHPLFYIISWVIRLYPSFYYTALYPFFQWFLPPPLPFSGARAASRVALDQNRVRAPLIP